MRLLLLIVSLFSWGWVVAQPTLIAPGQVRPGVKDGEVLTTVSGKPVWAAPSGAGDHTHDSLELNYLAPLRFDVTPHIPYFSSGIEKEITDLSVHSPGVGFDFSGNGKFTIPEYYDMADDFMIFIEYDATYSENARLFTTKSSPSATTGIDIYFSGSSIAIDDGSIRRYTSDVASFGGEHRLCIVRKGVLFRAWLDGNFLNQSNVLYDGGGPLNATIGNNANGGNPFLGAISKFAISNGFADFDIADDWTENDPIDITGYEFYADFTVPFSDGIDAMWKMAPTVLDADGNNGEEGESMQIVGGRPLYRPVAKPDAVLYWEDFGAVPGDGNNDLPAIQAALDSAAKLPFFHRKLVTTRNPGKVFEAANWTRPFSVGLLEFSNNNYSRITLDGRGVKLQVIDNTGITVNSIVCTDASNGGVIEDVHVTGFRFAGLWPNYPSNPSTTYNAVTAPNVGDGNYNDHLTVSDIECDHIPGSCVILTTARDAVVERIKSDSIRFHTVALSASTGADHPGYEPMYWVNNIHAEWSSTGMALDLSDDDLNDGVPNTPHANAILSNITARNNFNFIKWAGDWNILGNQLHAFNVRSQTAAIFNNLGKGEHISLSNITIDSCSGPALDLETNFNERTKSVNVTNFHAYDAGYGNAFSSGSAFRLSGWDRANLQNFHVDVADSAPGATMGAIIQSHDSSVYVFDGFSLKLGEATATLEGDGQIRFSNGYMSSRHPVRMWDMRNTGGDAQDGIFIFDNVQIKTPAFFIGAYSNANPRLVDFKNVIHDSNSSIWHNYGTTRPMITSTNSFRLDGTDLVFSGDPFKGTLRRWGNFYVWHNDAEDEWYFDPAKPSVVGAGKPVVAKSVEPERGVVSVTFNGFGNGTFPHSLGVSPSVVVLTSVNAGKTLGWLQNTTTSSVIGVTGGRSETVTISYIAYP